MAVYVTCEELDKILLSKIEPIETSLNYNGHEFKKLLSRVDTLEKTVKALQLENQALKSQINAVNTMVKENSALLDEQEYFSQKKIKRCIGILSKIRYFVSQQVLV